MEMAGIKDVLAKSLGSANPINVVKATMLGALAAARAADGAGATRRLAVKRGGDVAKLKITWKKSAIGHTADQKRTIRALGLRRLGQTVVHSDSPSCAWYDTQGAPLGRSGRGGE